MRKLHAIYRVLQRPWLIVALAAIFIILIITVILSERSRSLQASLRIMDSTAHSLVGSFASASEKTTAAVRAIENEIIQNILIKARLLRELEEQEGLTRKDAARYTAATGISVVRTDPQLACTILSGNAGTIPGPATAVWMQVLSAFTNAEVEETVFNLRDSGYTTSYWKGVALRCANGSILALVPPADTYNYRYLLGTGPLLRELCTVPNIEYIIWEDDTGIISAHGDYAAADNPAVHDLMEFQEPAPMQLTGGSTGIFRVGMSRAGLNRIEFESLVRLLILSAGIVLVSGILVHSAILRQQFEKERVQRERLASVGELAAGVAHEVRNPLNAVALTLQQLSSDAAIRNTDPENATLLEIARDEVNRANMILTDFLEYARPARLNFRETDINELCERVVRAVQAQADSQGVTITKRFAEHLPLIALDLVHIHQSLLNIILNALDAMPGGGTLILATRQQRGEAILSISDTGNGIAAEDRERVFDLYYTTKHKGIGLGLPFVHKIIMMHNGRVTISENKPTGVVVEVRIPVMGNG